MYSNYRYVVGINFGLVHSGIGHVHVCSESPLETIAVKYDYQGVHDNAKVPTVLSYDDKYENVQSWGFPALDELKWRNYKRHSKGNPVELFKLLSGKMDFAPPLTCEKTITDYFRELGEVVKDEIYRHWYAGLGIVSMDGEKYERWRSVDFYENVFIILAVPDNYTISTQIMRECAFKAGLLNDRRRNLEFITEYEATSFYWMKYLLEEHKLSIGKKFMVAECRDNIIATRLFLRDENLSLISEKIENNCNCGDSFVDQEIIKFLIRKIGLSAINLFRGNYPGKFQYLLNNIKCQLKYFPEDENSVYVDLEEIGSSITQYCEGEYRNNLIEDEWIVNLENEDIKLMFDPIIERIIQLINYQLSLCNNDCFVLLLDGNIIELKYLRLRIKETFHRRVQVILTPDFLIYNNATIRGAVLHVECGNTFKITKQVHLPQDENQLHNNLEEKYNDLTNKYDEEKNQHQIIVENLKSDIKGVEEKYIKNIQQLENQINDSNQQYQSKIKMQEQRENEMQKKFQDEIQAFNNELNNYRLLYNNIQEKYNDLTSKYDEEKNQHQIIVENLKSDIIGIEEKNFKNLQKLKNLVDDSNQQCRSKIIMQKQKFQDEIQASNNELNNYRLLYNNIQEKYNDLTSKYDEEKNQHQIIVENLKSDIKGVEEKYIKNIQQLENQINDSNQQYQSKINMQEQRENEMKTKFQDEIQASNNYLNEYKLLYNNIQEKYSDLTREYDEEKNKSQIIIKNLVMNIQQLENQISEINQQYQNKIKLLEQKENKLQDEIQNSNKYKSLYDKLQEKYDDATNKYNKAEDKYLKNISQLENQINDINQQHQNKIKFQEQIDQLQQSIELKENQLQTLEKEKEEKDAENDKLYQKNTKLMNQLENSLFENELSNYQLEDNPNYVVNLNNDISELSNNLRKYITDLKQDVVVNMDEIGKLLLLYNCPIKITNQKDDLLLIQAVLQRHIIETIFSYATKYFQSTGQHYHLESDIINKASLLSTLLTNASKHHTGNDEITDILSTKLRRQIYLILNNCGFSDIYGKNGTTYEHPFIAFYKEKLNKTMNELRIIKGQEKITFENLAATIIREIIKIFWFKLQIHVPVLQYVWIPYNVKMDETFMKRENCNDNENLYVGLCYFPLIGRELASNNYKVYVPAKVYTKKLV
ncbi:hypothetical protein RclHR1_09760004 [Rhizophagus clarus]|uniref:Uncharacterized protein n=1 Tax=Rhizophagus clarus TaxID=94130 RepID=A0A2Z6S5F0_9GLOM|nr:hypothetical protein RclHR1_09760004 [Rhizophagus clarus]